MTTLKLSGNMIEIPINQHKTVTVKKMQRNAFEVKVQFIDLHGIIVKSFVAANSEVDNFITYYVTQYNFTVIS